MLATVINVAVRGAVVLVGLGILGGVFRLDRLTPEVQQAFGIVVVVFGIYRLVTYMVSLRRGDSDNG